MRDYLVARGVPEQQIISEEKSTSTEENFAFSRQLMEQAGLRAEEPILLVSNDFHCYRAKQYAAMAGFAKVTALAAPTPFTAIIPCYLREVAALVYYWLFRSSRTGFLHPLKKPVLLPIKTKRTPAGSVWHKSAPGGGSDFIRF